MHAENIISATDRGVFLLQTMDLSDRRDPRTVVGYIRSVNVLENLVSIVATLVRSLLVMPTVSSDALAADGNRGLEDAVGVIDVGSPRIADIDPHDGAVTMMPA